MKKNTIICISREFGSGGREVGQQLSKKLGIPFYDKEILARVAEESDMSEEFVKNHEENAVYSHIINVPIGHRFPGVDTEEIMTPEKLFMIQAHVIHELAAENESCIFVGRCADVVLKDHENCYSFFIHSPLEERIKRIVETEHVTERQAKKMIKQTDWERSSYHNYYTKQKWGDPGNYDLMINSARTGIQKDANCNGRTCGLYHDSECWRRSCIRSFIGRQCYGIDDQSVLGIGNWRSRRCRAVSRTEKKYHGM